MKIIKGIEDIFAIKEGQRKIIKKTTFWEDIEEIMNKKPNKEIGNQMNTIFNDIILANQKNSNWEAVTIAKDKNGKLYWFTHSKKQNISELMYYHNATEVISWNNNLFA